MRVVIYAGQTTGIVITCSLGWISHWKEQVTCGLSAATNFTSLEANLQALCQSSTFPVPFFTKPPNT